MRTALKRLVMHLYCHGCLPATLVRLVFRVFRLRSE